MDHPCRIITLLALVAVAACAGDSPPEAAEIDHIGFVLVGTPDDLGYNQAIAEGAGNVAREFPDIEVELAFDVPESAEATETMERMIADGADLLFATSFGHLPMAEEVAAAHPDVLVVHQGGVVDGTRPNLGSYWGSHHESMYLAGMVAADVSTSGRLGFVAAFPIPATYANVDAFALGAQRRRPDAVVHVRFTDSWCDPDAQRAFFDDLLAAGVDVLGLHQDCTETLLRLAEAEQVGIVGFHSDGSEVARTSWLIGAVWNWTPVFLDIVETAVAGEFAESVYPRNFRGTTATGDNAAILTEPGPRVGPATIAAVEEARASFADGSTSVFAGPLVDVDGEVRVAEGDVLGTEAVDALDWFVAGVEIAG